MPLSLPAPRFLCAEFSRALIPFPLLLPWTEAEREIEFREHVFILVSM